MNEISNEEDLETLKNFVEKNYWKVRDCLDYKEEYNECSSLRGRFQQTFLYGDTLDCSKWKEDMDNCAKPKDDVKAYASIIRHEDERMGNRIKAHVANDVWRKRREPPSNWNAALPDYVQEKQDKSFQYADKESSLCIIS